MLSALSIFIGQRDFIDGTVRNVYRDEQGQFVHDDDGQLVYGVWQLDAEALDDAPPMADAPAIVDD